MPKTTNADNFTKVQHTNKILHYRSRRCSFKKKDKKKVHASTSSHTLSKFSTSDLSSLPKCCSTKNRY